MTIVCGERNLSAWVYDAKQRTRIKEPIELASLLNTIENQAQPPISCIKMDQGNYIWLKEDIKMSYDFSNVQQMNAMSTRPNFRRKSRLKPALLVVTLASLAVSFALVK